MLNNVILIGRLTADPESLYTQALKALAKMRLAVDGPYTNSEGKPQTVFVNVIVWGKLAEVCAERLGKGRLVAVEGKLNIQSYEAKDGSGKRSSTEIVCSSVRFLDWPKDQEHQKQEEQMQDPKPAGDENFGGLDFSDFGTEIDYSKDSIEY